MVGMVSSMSTGTPLRRDGRSAELKGTARERLLDAALTELREHGYAGASLSGIARRAGLTKGAVYWSFKDKRDLFLALIEERLDAPARELISFTENAPAQIDTAPAISAGVSRLVREYPELVVVLVEHWALAVRNEEMREPYLARQAMVREAPAGAPQARPP